MKEYEVKITRQALEQNASNKVQVIAIIYGKRDQMKRLANMDMQ